MASRYAAAHQNPQGPGDSRPTALEIVKDEGLQGKLVDKVALITGCSSGIGIETARALNATGAKLFLGVRDVAKGQTALSDILEPGRVELLKMDLNSLESVRAAAADFLKRSKRLNILINNAGIMATPQGKTADGFELQFGTCHLAHFLLFELLKPTLLASSIPSFNSRVVALSSSGHRTGGVRFDDYNFEKGDYSPWVAYGQAKTSNIYFANELDRRYGGNGLHGLSVMPGGIMTGLQKNVPDAVKDNWTKDKVMASYMKSPEQGAATTVYAALSKDWEGRGGRYLEDCAEAELSNGSGGTTPGHAPHAYNKSGEKQLWTDSLRFVGIQDDDQFEVPTSLIISIINRAHPTRDFTYQVPFFVYISNTLTIRICTARTTLVFVQLASRFCYFLSLNALSSSFNPTKIPQEIPLPQRHPLRP